MDPTVASYLPIFLASIGVLAVAVAVDALTHRGFALAVLAFVALGCAIAALVGIILISRDAPSTDSLAIAALLATYIIIGAVLAVLVTLGGLAEAILARQTNWIVTFAVLILVCWTVVIPLALVFVYALRRCVHPITRAVASIPPAPVPR